MEDWFTSLNNRQYGSAFGSGVRNLGNQRTAPGKRHPVKPQCGLWLTDHAKI
jgi:hypothetical protein